MPADCSRSKVHNLVSMKMTQPNKTTITYPNTVSDYIKHRLQVQSDFRPTILQTLHYV